MADDFDENYDEEEYEEEEQEEDPYIQINELKQKLSLLQKTKEAQRTRYKKEMHMIVDALIDKHKELQKENHYLQQQIHQVMGEGQNDDFLADLKQTIAEQKKEVSTLRKLVKQYEEQNSKSQKSVAELGALRELIQEKDSFIQELEEKNQEFVYQLEAKDNIISRISTQVANMEAEVYALNKRARSSGDENTQQYLDELHGLKQKIADLEAKKAHYQQLAQQAAQAKAQAAEQASAQPAAAADTSSEAEPQSDEEYEEAMDMLLEELQENLSTYDEISSQFSQARV